MLVSLKKQDNEFIIDFTDNEKGIPSKNKKFYANLFILLNELD